MDVLRVAPAPVPAGTRQRSDGGLASFVCRPVTGAGERSFSTGADLRARAAARDPVGEARDDPLVQEPRADDRLYTGGDAPSLLTNLHYLFRDWGWPAAPPDENARTLASVRRVLGDAPAPSH